MDHGINDGLAGLDSKASAQKYTEGGGRTSGAWIDWNPAEGTAATQGHLRTSEV